ncbi:hypothetical protein JG688_00017071 [Phytophthora aleatoria]|uniref:DDE-1 domain-containing protein n=1 Tax=Phytophthora aleatoria TaxID=2496075 RepID=A0A8J5IB49_9STRA|nr:hypothetical protein JG688_00017071 [Phytophthora aleatoria]
MHPAAQRAAPPKRRASYTAREKLDAANALEATKDVARVIKERYPDLSASAYESRRKLVLKWLRNKPKIEMHATSVCQPADVAWNFPFKARLRAYWVGYLREQLRAHNSGNKFALTAPDRVKVSKWVSMAWDELSSTTIANGYKKAFGPLLDDADIAAADLIENLSRHCAIDADIGEVDSDDDIEVNEVDEE